MASLFMLHRELLYSAVFGRYKSAVVQWAADFRKEPPPLSENLGRALKAARNSGLTVQKYPFGLADEDVTDVTTLIGSNYTQCKTTHQNLFSSKHKNKSKNEIYFSRNNNLVFHTASFTLVKKSVNLSAQQSW